MKYKYLKHYFMGFQRLFVTIFVSSDFDDDGTLDCGDLEKLVNCLTGETEDTRLTPDEMRQLITNVSSEASLLCGLAGSSPDS